MSADRAALNGESIKVTTNSSATMIHSAVAALARLASAITPTRTIRARSQAIISRRRGRRSARPDSPRPPTTQGRNVTAKATADSSADRVRS